MFEERRKAERSANQQSRRRETGIACIDVAKMDLPLIMETGTGEQPVRPVEQGHARTTLSEHERRAAPRQSSAKYSNRLASPSIANMIKVTNLLLGPIYR